VQISLHFLSDTNVLGFSVKVEEHSALEDVLLCGTLPHGCLPLRTG
jgi:hypothetical protein